MGTSPRDAISTVGFIDRYCSSLPQIIQGSQTV